MGFLDKIKKLFAEEKPQEIQFIENPAEKLKRTTNELAGKREELKKRAETAVKNLVASLKHKIVSLENLDIDKRKENEKLKLVVKENFRLYVDYLRKLIYDLEKVNEDYVNKVSQLTNNFMKYSTPAFEKATFLIGEQLGEVKKDVSSFLREISSITQENILVFNKENILKEVSSIKARIEESNLLIINSGKKIEENNKILCMNKEKSSKLESEISNLKESKEYKNAQEQRENSRLEIQKLEKEIIKIKEKIDFKLLASIFHTVEKKNSLIHEYANNFRQALEEDKSFEIIELAKAMNLNISQISDIKANIDHLKREKLTEIDLIIKNSEEKISSLKTESEKISLEIQEESRKIEKTKEKIIELEKEIDEKINKL